MEALEALDGKGGGGLLAPAVLYTGIWNPYGDAAEATPVKLSPWPFPVGFWYAFRSAWSILKAITAALWPVYSSVANAMVKEMFVRAAGAEEASGRTPVVTTEPDPDELEGGVGFGGGIAGGGLEKKSDVGDGNAGNEASRTANQNEARAEACTQTKMNGAG